MKQFTETKEISRRFENAAGGEDKSLLSSAVFFLLAATLVVSVVAFGAADAWALGLFSVVAGVIVILWAVEAWREREFRFNTSSLQLPLLALIMIGLVQLLPLRSFDNAGGLLDNIAPSAALSLDAYATRFFIIQLIVHFVFFAAALTFINSGKRLRKIVLTIIVFGGVMAFVGILQRLASPDAIYGLRPTPQAIPFASFVNQHHFAAFMNMTLGLTLGLFFGKAAKKDKNPLLLIAVFMMLIGLVLTGSRGGILSFFAVLGFCLLPKLLSRGTRGKADGNGARENFRSKFSFLAGLAAIGAVVVGTLVFLGGDQSLLRGVGMSSGQGDVTSGRTHFWSIALQIFLDHPILGAGLNGFGAAFSRYDTWNGTFRVEQAHNDYLQILADAGIVGFVCVAAFIYLLFKKALPNMDAAQSSYRRSVATGALAGCFGILVHSFFDFPLRTPSNAFFFLTLAAIATVSIVEKRRAREEREAE